MAYRIRTDDARIQPNIGGIADRARKRERTVSSFVRHVRQPHGGSGHRNPAFRDITGSGAGGLQGDAGPFLALARRRDEIFDSATYAPGRRLAAGSASAVAKRRAADRV